MVYLSNVQPLFADRCRNEHVISALAELAIHPSHFPLIYPSIYLSIGLAPRLIDTHGDYLSNVESFLADGGRNEHVVSALAKLTNNLALLELHAVSDVQIYIYIYIYIYASYFSF